MSMPSSRLEVATTQRRRPDLRSSSMSAALLLADRAVVGAGEHERLRVGDGGRAARSGRMPPMSSAGTGAPAWPHRPRLGQHPLLVDLVEPRGQPLGEPPRVREHDGRAVLEHEVDDRLLDVRPDRAGLRCGAVVVAARERRGAELAHVVDGHDDAQVEASCPTAGRRSSPGRCRRGSAPPPPPAAPSPRARCAARASAAARRAARARARGARRAWWRRRRAPRRRSPSRRSRASRGPAR